MINAPLWAELDAAVDRTLASIEPIAGGLVDEARMIHRARASMYVAMGAIKSILEAGLAFGPEGAVRASEECLGILEWVRFCNDPVVEAMRDQPIERLQRFAAGLGITCDGLTQPQLFEVLNRYFKAHAKPPGDTPS